ncbi:MAG: methyltransferase domain-containing protein [Planctomycetaceae bacterium]|nr:methyltransferase domain-containing protein [Planctomycetaceae bacterium]
MKFNEPVLHATQFPRSNAYNPEWVLASGSGGANSLWLTEWLTSIMDLKPGMRVLDLGCGRAMSSIFFAREFGVTTWATDLWFSPQENSRRIHDAGLESLVFPIRADARNLPFATEFFDAIISIDAFAYFGTDDHYLSYLARYLKPDGVLGISCAGFVDEFDDETPPHLAELLEAEPAMWSMHSPRWWRRHWEKTGIVGIERADLMPEGWKYWLEWHKQIAPDNQLEITTLEADQGRCMGYYRVVARRRNQVQLPDPIITIPENYLSKPLLRP